MFEIVLHVHDEAVVEVDENVDALPIVKRILEQEPSWAAGLPIAVDCWEGKRYRK